MSALKEALDRTCKLMDQALSKLLPAIPSSSSQALDAPLLEAMHYSTLAGGKRLRAFLVIESSKLFDVPLEKALRVASAIEMIHGFSLTHDDLPALDNADLRRGKPSCHAKYGESTAILAGDALHALAFEILVSPLTHSNPDVRCKLVYELAKATGYDGICGGQIMDIKAEHKQIEMETIVRLERLKTGSLLAFSARAGAILGEASEEALHVLDAFAHDFGVVFQITDDLLDLEGTCEEVGKSVGVDALLGKATIVNLLGKDAALEHAHMLTNQAIHHLDYFGKKADLLKNLTLFLLKRRS